MAHLLVNGVVADAVNQPVGGATVYGYLAVMEPSGNPVIMNADGQTDIEGDFQLDFELIAFSWVYSAWVAVFDPATQKAGSGYDVGWGFRWADGAVFGIGSIELFAASDGLAKKME